MAATDAVPRSGAPGWGVTSARGLAAVAPGVLPRLERGSRPARLAFLAPGGWGRNGAAAARAGGAVGTPQVGSPQVKGAPAGRRAVSPAAMPLSRHGAWASAALVIGLLLGFLLSRLTSWSGLTSWPAHELRPWLWLSLLSLAGVAGAWRALSCRLTQSRHEDIVAPPPELAQAQAEFLGTVCHELRTPLTVVCGYSELLRTQGLALQPAAARMVERIEAASGQLARLVDDLLDFSRIERGELVVQPEDVDVVPVLQEVVAGFRHQPGAVRVRVELPESLPAHADPVRLAQGAANFLANALKYAPQGPITLRALAAGKDVVRVEVEDCGPGIRQDEQGYVWDAFYRSAGVASAGTTRGTGIGLAVVKALVAAQGGRVGLESALGQGSRFWFELPVTAPSGALAPL